MPTARPDDRSGAAPQMTRTPRIIIGVLLLVCLCVMLGIAFWPTPVDAGGRDTLLALIDRLQAAGAPSWFDYRFVESAANVVLFIPLGALLALELPLKLWWIAPLTTTTFSVAIELGQTLLPARVATIADVYANAAGGLLGATIVLVVRLLVSAQGRPRPT
ncbi:MULTISPECIES: VanZ family protein [unclassified Plantibacter]|uniref:VanZ family protein n=1 Tax=unclassified Plantibacter TaxID=2624265 RepID=UPI000B060F5A|nr:MULTISPECIES: VanZ family protein [unclassified Plantibacter]